jgi:hypothetical protein
MFIIHSYMLIFFIRAESILSVVAGRLKITYHSKSHTTVFFHIAFDGDMEEGIDNCINMQIISSKIEKDLIIN